MKKKYILWGTLTALLLSGCGSKSIYRIAMNQKVEPGKGKVYLGAENTRTEIDARILNDRTAEIVQMSKSPHNEGGAFQLEVPISSSTATGIAVFGLAAGVASLVDRISDNNEKDIQLEPLRAVLNDYDISTEFQNIVEQELKQVSWLQNADKITMSKKTKYTSGINEYLFNISTRFMLTSDFRTLQVYSDVSLEKLIRGKVRKSRSYRAPRIYRNLFRYTSPALEKDAKLEQQKIEKFKKVNARYDKQLAESNSLDRRRFLKRERVKELKKLRTNYLFAESNVAMAKLWTENDGELLKQYLNESAKEIASMILLDLLDSRESKQHISDKQIPIYEPGLQVVEETSERVIVRDIMSDKIGQLCSLVKGSSGAYCKYSL